MEQEALKTDYPKLCSCGTERLSSLLRLLASTSKKESFCSGVEALMRRFGVKSNCSINELLNLESLEDRFNQIFVDKSVASNLSSAVASDLLLSKTSCIRGVKLIESDKRNCGCILIESNLRVFIPAPHSGTSAWWMEMHISGATNNTYLSQDLIEGIQWALLLHMELSSSRSKDRFSNAGKMTLLPSHVSNRHCTKRQLQIIHLVREDFSNSDIGIQLHISTSLVKLELGRVFKILGISNRKELFDPLRF